MGYLATRGGKYAAPILIDGLRSLEYRGYDSAGIFVASIGARKALGSVNNLEDKLSSDIKDTTGIAHTRWATHGEPTESNAHPHSDCSGNLWIVHNGIIENYKILKEKLKTIGHTFQSSTDSEVLAHLIEDELSGADNLEQALTCALRHIQGTYGIVVMQKDNPDHLVVARMGSPIVLGIGNGEHIVASDASAILRHTKDVIYLDDGECATMTPDSYRVFTLDHEERTRIPDTIEWDLDAVQKGGHKHFMMKEILEGPEVLKNSARGRILVDEGVSKLGGLQDVNEQLKKIKRIIIVACGTAYHAGLAGKYIIEESAGIPVEVELGSEFRYRKMVFDKNTALLVISQSGETADTLAPLKEAKRKGILTLGIVNTVGSTIARETDAGVYNHAGPEIGVASTKAFISQIEVLALFALFLGRQRGLSLEAGKKFAEELLLLPQKLQTILDKRADIEKVAKKYAQYQNMLFVGRKHNFPIAYEGALKLKEISYIHAEGYGAGEMKHGPIALIEENFPTVAIVLKDSVYDKTLSNIEEIKTRKGRVLAIATEGDDTILELADDVIFIPEVSEMLSPMLSVVPLQLFAYYIGVSKGYNVDKPRNLAKSVTVE